MTRKIIFSILAAIYGGFLWPGATRVVADPDDKAADEKVTTEVTVQVGKITTATLHDYVLGYGGVEPAPATTGQPAAGAQLSAPSSGVVTKVDVIEGQHVEKGDVLVELNSQAAEAELERQKKLYALQNTSLKNL